MSKVRKLLLAVSIVAGACLLPSHNAFALELEREGTGLGVPGQDEEGSGLFNRRTTTTCLPQARRAVSRLRREPLQGLDIRQQLGAWQGMVLTLPSLVGMLWHWRTQNAPPQPCLAPI